MSYRCENCRRSFAGTPTRSFTGRRLCHQCSAGIVGAGVGYGSSGTFQGAITTSWSARWLSRVFRRDKPAGPTKRDQA